MSTLSDPEFPLIIHAFAIGPEVQAVRAQPTAGGRLLAVMSKAIYLETEAGRIIGIVSGEIDGPLSLRVADFAPLRDALAASPGAKFTSNGDELCIAGHVSIRWAGAPGWMPSLPQDGGTAAQRLGAAQALAQLISETGVLEGCAPVVARIVGARRAMPLQPLLPMGAVSSRIIESLGVARTSMLMGDCAAAVAALLPLIGLGPGLTPSGDDLLAGIAASLVWRACSEPAAQDLACKLTAGIRAAAQARTNRISARLLSHACDGVLYAPAMDLGGALLAGDIAATIISASRLLSIGETTGSDLATGILIGTGMVAGTG